MFTIKSRTTAVGLRAHAVRSLERESALLLFEQALELDEQSQLVQFKGDSWVSFIASDAECQTAVDTARALRQKSEDPALRLARARGRFHS